MMAAEGFLDIATGAALGLLILALFVIIARLALGPTVADRVLGLDMLVTVGIGLIAVIAVRTGQFAYVDVAIALGLVGFLATTAFARFLIHHARRSPGGLIAAGSVETPGEDANPEGVPDD